MLAIHAEFIALSTFRPSAIAYAIDTIRQSIYSVSMRSAINGEMAFTTDDRLAICELIEVHGQLMDAGEFDRINKLFTVDFVYDLEHLGSGRLEGAKAFVEAATALGDDNPLGHHVTNPQPGRIIGNRPIEVVFGCEWHG